VIAGPSGVGKGTVVRRVHELDPDLYVSVSVTTRRPRATERDGVDYFFIDEEGFDRLIAEGELLEWAEIFGHRSGTPARPIRDVLREGRDALLEIDVQGAAIVRERVPEAVLILLVPPSLAELERRLRTRATEDEDKLARRLAKAEQEIAQGDWFDHVIVNDDLEGASSQVAAIIETSRANPEDASS
jgi:guanylate kinase